MMASDVNRRTIPRGEKEQAYAPVFQRPLLKKAVSARIAVFMTIVMLFSGVWSSQSSCRAQDVNNTTKNTTTKDKAKNNEESEGTGKYDTSGKIRKANTPLQSVSQSAELSAEQQADFALWKSAVTESTDATARRRAAGKLLESGWDISFDLLSLLLQNENQPEVITAIADAVSEVSNPPEKIFQWLIGAYERSADTVRESLEIAVTQYAPAVAIPEISAIVHDKNIAVANRIALIGLLSRFVEVETVDALIPCLDKEEPAAVRQAAGKALAMIAGVDLGESRLRWENWWERHRNAGREGLLAANITRLQQELKEVRKRNRLYRDERTDLVASLVHWIEQAYALEPKDHRPGLVVALLGDDREEIRLLGLRLIEQAMSNGEPMPAEVTNAVAGRVEDVSAEVRSAAIRQLIFLDGAKAGAIAAKQLENEGDLTVRLALEAALTRYPSKNGELVLLKIFIDSPGRNALVNNERTAVAGALSSAFRASFSPGMDQRNKLAEVVLGDIKDQDNNKSLQNIINELSGEEAGLLAWSPNPMARKACAMILAGDKKGEAPDEPLKSQARRLTVARELAASGLDDEALYAQAGDDKIHAIAFGVLQSREGPLQTLEEVLADFPQPNEKTRQADISAIMAALPIKDWVPADDKLAASNHASLDQRAAWLSRVLSLSATESATIVNPSKSGERDNTTTDTNTEASEEVNGRENNTAEAQNTGNDNAGNTENDNAKTDNDSTKNNPAPPTGNGMIRRQVCIRLAEVNLLRGLPTQALTALKAAPAAQTDQDNAERLRAVAMIASGESGDALPDGLDKSVSVWLEALAVVQRATVKDDKDETIRKQLIKTLAMKIRELGKDQLSESDQAKITAILGNDDKTTNDNDNASKEDNKTKENNTGKGSKNGGGESSGGGG